MGTYSQAVLDDHKTNRELLLEMKEIFVNSIKLLETSDSTPKDVEAIDESEYEEMKCETTPQPDQIRGDEESEAYDQYQKGVGGINKIESKDNIEFFNLPTFDELSVIADPLTPIDTHNVNDTSVYGDFGLRANHTLEFLDVCEQSQISTSSSCQGEDSICDSTRFFQNVQTKQSNVDVYRED